MLPSADEYEITPAELQTIFAEENNTSVRLIDCREEDEWAICRIESPGERPTELIPLSRFAAEAPEKLGEESRPVVIYCHHGMRSMNATLFLRERGIEKVWSLAGGIDLWSTQVDPSVPRY